ncbi:MAG: hypothetical protein JNL28_12095 [Planctomycetes bacterium]|nr:hypothetical protein [Planctomycetota bacterium]
MVRDPKSRALLLFVVALVAGVVALRWWEGSRTKVSIPVVDTGDGAGAGDLTGLDAQRAVATSDPEDGSSSGLDFDTSTQSALLASLAGNGLWLRLIDAEDHPKPYVELTVAEELWLTLGESHPEKYIEERLVTNSDGRVRLSARQPSEIEHVELSMPNGRRVSVRSPFEFAVDQKSEVVLRYPERVTIRGRVLDLAGQPIRMRARVLLDSRSVAADERGVRTFVPEDETFDTDSEARFRFDTISGWFSLSASAAEVPIADSARVGINPPTRSAEVDLFVATRERTVRVRVVSAVAFRPEDAWVGGLCDLPWPSGPAQMGVSVERVRDTQVMHARRVGDTWELGLPRVGQWTVRAGCKGFETTLQPLTDGVSELTLELRPRDLPPAHALAGRVVDERGEPLAANIKLLRTNDMGHFEFTSTNARGEFRLTSNEFWANHEHAYVFAEATGYGSAGIGPIAIGRERDDLEIVLSPGLTIAGRVNGLTPNAEARLVVSSPTSRFARPEIPPAGRWLPGSLPGEPHETYDNGAFRLRNLTAGEYELWIDPSDGVTTPARALVRAGDETVRIELGSGLQGGLELLCRVVDDTTSAPISGAQVELRGSDFGLARRGGRGRTSANGLCTLRGHTAGRWSVHVSAAGYAFLPDRFTDFDEGQRFVEVRLKPARTLTVALTDEAGTPRSEVEVCATTLAGELLDLQDRYGHYDGCYARSDASGKAVLTGLPEGRVRIVIGWKNAQRSALSDDEETFLASNPLGFAVIEHDIVREGRNFTRHILR